MSLKNLSILAFALALSSRLEAVTINFSDLTPGNLGTSHYVDVGTGLAVDGLYKSGSSWLAANLYVRDQTNDHGLGVCNPRETPCPGPSGGGDINELDNAGNAELIRLTLPTGYHWVSVQVSSLDENDGDDDDELERGQLWGDVDGVPGFNSLIWQFTGDDSNVEPSFSEFGFAENSPYLFFEPVDWFEETNNNNDFLVYQVTVERSTPEPATLALLGIGLLAMGGLRRKR